MWRWESSVLPSRSCNWPGLRRSSAPPANRQWLDATVFLCHSRHQGRSQADGRYLLPRQALLDVPDQKRLVAARNFHRCLPIDRSALCLFRDVLWSYLYLLSQLSTFCTIPLLWAIFWTRDAWKGSNRAH